MASSNEQLSLEYLGVLNNLMTTRPQFIIKNLPKPGLSEAPIQLKIDKLTVTLSRALAREVADGIHRACSADGLILETKICLP